MISFIVSVFDRPQMLNACLATIAVQTPSPADIHVAANSSDMGIFKECERICKNYEAKLHLTAAPGRTSYDSAEIACDWCNGDWLCFASDDSLYAQGFSEIMLHEAERNPKAGLIHCNCVYKQGSITGSWPAYTIMDSAPRMGCMDKTNFIIRRELFKGFPPHPMDYRDGALAEQFVKEHGISKTAKAPGCLVVHQ